MVIVDSAYLFALCCPLTCFQGQGGSDHEIGSSLKRPGLEGCSWRAAREDTAPDPKHPGAGRCTPPGDRGNLENSEHGPGPALKILHGDLGALPPVCCRCAVQGQPTPRSATPVPRQAFPAQPFSARHANLSYPPAKHLSAQLEVADMQDAVIVTAVVQVRASGRSPATCLMYYRLAPCVETIEFQHPFANPPPGALQPSTSSLPACDRDCTAHSPSPRPLFSPSMTHPHTTPF
ncbi:hypothetical protein BC628DRAFT_398171 [Trametes gibbosa]|nr:hypothetical protein BC628DRAFT_398171 [Trametes gibbosa]